MVPYHAAVQKLQPWRRKRPRWGCIGLSVLVVPCLTFAVGMVGVTLPATEGFPRDPVMESFAAEEGHVLGRGFVLVDQHDFEHPSDARPDTLTMSLEADTCLAVIAATWGHQYGTRLTFREGQRLLTAHEDPGGRVMHVQWCAPAASAQALEVQLERSGRDPWGRDGQSDGSVHMGVYRAPASAVGGLAAIDRGVIPDAVLASRPELMQAANASQPSGRMLAAMTVEAFSARLIPEDSATYAELYRGARNGSEAEVNPRLTPLLPSVPPAWRPGTAHTRETLHAAHVPAEHPSETHPAVREGEQDLVRVLAIVDGDRLGVNCADVQLIRSRYGFRTDVRRADAAGDSPRRLSHEGNVATDRVCAGQGTLVYVTPLTDRAPYTLRLFEG